MYKLILMIYNIYMIIYIYQISLRERERERERERVFCYARDVLIYPSLKMDDWNTFSFPIG